MLISVSICTWNRARLLDQTLTEMQALRIPTGVEWELLVVNNGCTDDTDGVIARHAPRLPIRRLFESMQGISNARNCAVAAANGELLLWTDDDVLVHQDWLSEYVSAAARWPEASFFGGPVEPWFEGSPPAWLLRVLPQVANVYALRDLGEAPIPLSQKRLPVGANFAVRISNQLRYPYDPTLGRKGYTLIGDEERSLIATMLADGLQGTWVPGARVRHYIPRTRQTIRYLRRWFSADGALFARRSRHDGSVGPCGKPRGLWRKAVRVEMRYRWRRLARQPEIWIEDLKASSSLWGRLSESSSHSSH